MREGIAVKTVWPGLAIHTDSPMSAARIAEVLVEHQRSGLCVKVPESLARQVRTDQAHSRGLGSKKSSGRCSCVFS